MGAWSYKCLPSVFRPKDVVVSRVDKTTEWIEAFQVEVG